MAKKNQTKSKAKKAEETVVVEPVTVEPETHTDIEEDVVVVTVPVETKPSPSKRGKKTTKAPVAVEPVVVPVVTEAEEEHLEEEGNEGETPEVSEPKKRVSPTKESVLATFDELIRRNEEELLAIKNSKTKTKGVKYLKSLTKNLRTLRNQTSRVMAKKNKIKREPNTKSGFQKLVKISNEMASFIGWNPKDLRSRNEVTRNICDYIKKNNLQDPEDRRVIRPDDKLKKLLKYDPNTVIVGKDGKPERGLFYYRLQTFMKPHFIDPDTTPVVAAPTKPASKSIKA